MESEEWSDSGAPGRVLGKPLTRPLSIEARTLLRAAGLIRQAGDVAAEMPDTAPGFAAGVLASATLVESFAREWKSRPGPAFPLTSVS